MSNPTADPHSGILGRIGGLDRLLHAALVLLVVVSAVRYISRHGMSAGALEVLGGAVLLLALRSVCSGRWNATLPLGLPCSRSCGRPRATWP